jgi:hypothetical protein
MEPETTRKTLVKDFKKNFCLAADEELSSLCMTRTSPLLAWYTEITSTKILAPFLTAHSAQDYGALQLMAGQTPKWNQTYSSPVASNDTASGSGTCASHNLMKTYTLLMMI